MTVDDELNQLDDSMRRLKIEYDIYFGGGSKRAPADLEWRVQSLLRKLSDSQRLSVSQRFRYNSIQQKYAIFSDLWRQKSKIKEEGYRRSQDALLAIQGLRTAEEHQAAKELKHKVATPDRPFKIAVSDPTKEQEHLKSLFSALTTAKKQACRGWRFHQLRSFSRIRDEEDAADPQTVFLRRRGVPGRAAERPRKADGETEKVIQWLMVSNQHSAPLGY